MGATNKTSEGRRFFKLKDSEMPEHKKEMRFFEQVKKDGTWGDGEAFNSLSGTVASVKIKEYEWQGETKKNLVIELNDKGEHLEFSLGMRAMTAQSILNVLAGGNGFELAFNCGKVREANGKVYSTLYVNRMDGLTNEENRTNWKYKPEEMPKVTTTTDEEGNKIKKGQKAADLFWEGVVEEVIEKLKGLDMTPAPQNTTSTAKQDAMDHANEENDKSANDSGDLPF